MLHLFRDLAVKSSRGVWDFGSGSEAQAETKRELLEHKAPAELGVCGVGGLQFIGEWGLGFKPSGCLAQGSFG